MRLINLQTVAPVAGLLVFSSPTFAGIEIETRATSVWFEDIVGHMATSETTQFNVGQV